MQPQTLASEVSSLYTLPELALRVNTLLDSPDASARELVEVIELDTGLAATVLRLANSAMYGHGRVNSLPHAVATIGHQALRGLVLAAAAVRVFRDIPAEFVNMDSFWENSITCAVLAQLIGQRAHLPESEALFLAGLLHGVGRLVFYARRPREYREVLQRVQDSDLAVESAETLVFGFNHAQLGAALLGQWGLPRKLRQAVAQQLTPSSAFSREAAAVHLAVDMANHMAPCIRRPQEATVYSPGPSANTALRSLDLRADDLADISLEALASSLEIVEILRPGAGTIF
ncbi:MAG TPA: HDOD domain-containing protein [Thiobacillaceae bacterium]|nr:HDOD domain-containing protein [Thiobacillaceae bacterium]HNU64194.1 HDOD domain-containing protein [Thiobacillaceae bacterium]